jgi:protein-L-isoaspartate O-methyltransferase
MFQSKFFLAKLLSGEQTHFWSQAEALMQKKLARFSPDDMAFLNEQLSIPFIPNDMDLGVLYGLQNSETESVTSHMHSTHYFEPSPTILIKHIFEHVTLRPGQTFLDVGGGVGQVNMLAGLVQPQLGKNICFDLNRDLLETGKNYLSQKKFPFEIEFKHGDIFKNMHLFSQADVVYHYVAFDKTGIRQLVTAWSEQAKPGAVFVLEEVAYRSEDLDKMQGFRYRILNNAGRHLYAHHASFILKK